MPDEEARGFLFPKKNRQGKQPNATGKIVWKGETIEIAAWNREAKSGVRYLSLRLQEARTTAQTTAQESVPVTSGDFSTGDAADNDDTPF